MTTGGTIARRVPRGFRAATSGTATILSGTTSIVVNHTITTVVPSLRDIFVVPAENPTNDVGLLWVTSITSTQFTVNCRNEPGVSNLDVAWMVLVL